MHTKSAWILRVVVFVLLAVLAAWSGLSGV